MKQVKAYAAFLLLFAFTGGSIDARAEESKWEKNILAFEEQDRTSPVEPGGILFLGSSSIRLWDLPKYFSDLPVLNRGFGGSEVEDSLKFTPRIVLPYKPKLIVFYAGDNDISRGDSPESVANEFKQLCAKVHAELPETKILFISIKPSIARWKLVEEMREANRLIRGQCEADRRLVFVDIDKPMIGEDGMPKADLFLDDGLHLNEKGYDLWTNLIRPEIDKALGEAEPSTR